MELMQIEGEVPADAIERQTAIVAGAKLLLAGEHPAVQGSALAELLAIWLAGHQVQRETHEALLAMHIETVREFLPHCQAEIAAIKRAAQ